MKVNLVLDNLQRLLAEWGITSDDWIFAAQYAERLLGYSVRVRKGHLNLIINKSEIPWKVGEGYETLPPLGTKFSKQYQEFIRKTGFEFDIAPVSVKDFKKKVKNTVVYYTPGRKRKVLVQTPWGGLEELDEIFLKCTSKGWGEEKGYRIFPHLDDVKRAASERGEFKLAAAYTELMDKYRHFGKGRSPKVSRWSNKMERITGIVASGGKAKGRVNVVLDTERTKRFKKGEILVTVMTSPKFVVFMKKVSAIVTDEGGMLSHAAIVSRELGIPCVVGTRIATQILKDGDLVEVDAEKGVIRRIEKT